ncbi:MAG: Zn-dependent alcohol dehydrogenase [Chloroflexi bacterium]|nr:Zn-dependent alcohol dehydrogenase [Chloroflexota bacterium]
MYRFGEPAVVEEVQLDGPRTGEVLVRVAVAGVCHSDLHVVNGQMPFLPLPLVLGHEGAGIVEEVGPGVTSVKPGDHVILLWRTPCGRCHYCAIGRPAICEKAMHLRASGLLTDGTSRLSRDGQMLHHFNLCSCIAERAVMPEQSLLPIPDDVPLDVAAVIGCAVITGVGAVLTRAKVTPGSTVAVFGVGGVGLSAVMGAALANATQVIAVDVNDSKLEFSRQFGVTDLVNARAGDPVAQIRDLTGGRGVEYAFECIGVPPVMEQAFNATANGGTTVIVGATAPGTTMSVPTVPLVFQERSLLGAVYGAVRPWRDLPWLIDLFRAGKLPVDRLITHRYPLEQLNEAFAALERGEVARSVLTVS